MNMLECANAELRGATKTMFVDARNNLCHPTATSEELDDSEVFKDAALTVLETPIGCGEGAYIYNGYTMLGAKKPEDGKVYVPTGSLKTAARAHATNSFVLDGCDFHIDPDTWLLLHGNAAYDLREGDGFVVSDGNTVSFTDGDTHKCNQRVYKDALRAQQKALKFYAEFCVNTIIDLGGIPSEVYDLVADEPAFLYHGVTIFGGPVDRYSRADFRTLVTDMAFVPDVIESALLLLSGDIHTPPESTPLKGEMIWSVKTLIVALSLSVLGYPATFGRH